MKPMMILSALLMYLTCAFGLAVYVSNSLDMLEPEEERSIKEGKSFWTWNSPYGELNVHYVERGEGATHVVLLHGFRAHTYTWNKLIDPLVAAGFHVWAIDLIGYGLSDKPSNVPYTINFFVEQIETFLEAKNISEAHIAGNSMGGGLALNIALSSPHRIKTLTLINALGYPLYMPLYLAIGRHISHIWPPLLSPSQIRRGLKTIVYDEQAITDEQVHAYSFPYRCQGGIASTLATLQNFDNQQLADISQNYARLNCPVFIVWGDRDRLIPIDHYEKFLGDFPTARSLLIKECGHLPQEEKPQEVAVALVEFLQEAS